MSVRPQLNIRVTSRLLAELTAFAQSERRSLSDWARLTLADAAGVEVEKVTRTKAKNCRSTNNRPSTSRQR